MHKECLKGWYKFFIIYNIYQTLHFVLWGHLDIFLIFFHYRFRCDHVYKCIGHISPHYNKLRWLCSWVLVNVSWYMWLVNFIEDNKFCIWCWEWDRYLKFGVSIDFFKNVYQLISIKKRKNGQGSLVILKTYK